MASSSTINTFSGPSPYCRCCRNKNNLCNIHTVRIKKTSTTYIEMIAECVSSDVSNSDILPPWLCMKCSNKLNSFYRFKQMCFKTLENLKQVNSALKSNVEKKVLNNDDNEKKVHAIKIEADEEESFAGYPGAGITVPGTIGQPVKNDEEENLELETEVFNENIVCEELKIVTRDLVQEEEIKCDPTNVKLEIDVVDNYLYQDDNDYENYEDVVDSTSQNCEEMYEPNEIPVEMNQNDKEFQLILPQITDKQTECPICNKHMRCNSALLDHIKYDHFGIKYYCDVCKKYVNKENRHKRMHIKDKFPCDDCGEAFTNKPQYLQHIMQEHGKNGSFKCDCGETFANRRDLNTHKYMAHNKLSFKCNVCDQGFLRKDHLQNHLRRHLQGRKVRPMPKYVGKKMQAVKLISPEEIPLVGVKETCCPICTKMCSTNKRLLEHIQMIHLGEKFYCKICKKYYASETRHNMKHTPWAKCKECNKKFSTKKDYTDHMQSVHNVAQETCPHICHCGKKFQLLAHFRSHKYRVHKETDFICQFCSKGFLKKDRLKEHVQMHTKDETFACSECLKLFYNRSNLSKHRIRVHRNGDLYVCDYCDKVFKSKPYLKSHITAHDPKNKPFACLVCGKRFRRSDHRNNHQALVHKLERLNNNT